VERLGPFDTRFEVFTKIQGGFDPSKTTAWGPVCLLVV
jgi:hypothetical protein